MVLDAVARIEQTIETQQQAAPADTLPNALAAIRRSVVEARTATMAAFDKRIMNDALVPIQNGVRIIREISWRWREIGGDSRICDILESQAGAIEKAHSQLAARDDVAVLHSAFSLIETTLDGLWDSPGSEASPCPLKTASPTTSDEVVTLPEEAASHERAMAEPAVVEPEAATTTADDAPVTAADGATTANHIEREPAAEVSEQDIAHDDAVLDMIALEMGASDFEEPATDDTNIDRPETVELAPTAELIADSSDARIDSEAESTPEIAAPPSLGVSLLESGIVPRITPRSDPMAPFRRMTQAEKIAFFS
jgi:hypothetical protein